MFAVRLGSYSMCDLGVDAVLVVATEVDHAVRALVATALVPGGDPAVRVTPPLPCSGRTSDFSGSSE